LYEGQGGAFLDSNGRYKKEISKHYRGKMHFDIREEAFLVAVSRREELSYLSVLWDV